MDLLNVICGVCSIAGLLVSIFTASKVVKIVQNINSGNLNGDSNHINNITDTTIQGSFVGRNSINGMENTK